MITTALLQLVLLPVDDDRGDLLVHEEEDGEEEGGEGSEQVDVPWRRIIKHGDQPVSHIRPRWLNQKI